MTAAIVTQALTKRYGPRTALSRLDLEVHRGEVFGLIGPNGAGKTTVMRLLLDVIRPTAGSVSVMGHDPRSGGAALRRRVGYLPGELRLAGRARAGELLDHFGRLSGGVAAGAIFHLAERLGLDLSSQVGKLSKGNKQKVGLIQAFMHEPELLILDEPTSGLDPLVQQEFLSLLREAKATGQTVFLSSHVLSEIEQAADRVGVLHRGELIRLGRVDELRATQQRRLRATVRSQEGLREALEGLGRARDLTLVEREGEVAVTLLFEGDLDRLVKTLARFEVRDLLLEEPVLEDAVIGLYRGEGDMNLFRRELREGRRGLLGWAVGVAAAVLLYMPFFPSVGGPELTRTYVDMFPPELAELFGLQQLATGAGYAQSTYFGLLGFLLIAIAAVGWGSRAIAGAEDSGTLELTLAHAVTRWQVVVEATLALLFRVAILCAVGSLLVWALNVPAQLAIEPRNLVAATLALYLLTSLTGVAALFGGAVTGRSAVATGLGSFVAVAAYVLEAVARMADAAWLARLSPYYWAYGRDPITTGFDAGGTVALLVTTVVLVVVGGWRFSRRDVGTA